MKTARKLFALLLAILVLSSVAIPAIASTDNGDIVVYRTRTGSKYHRASCGYLKSSYPITLREAAERGLTPCSKCNPPRFNGDISQEPEAPSRSASKTSSGISTKTISGSSDVEAKQSLSSSKSKSSLFEIIWDWFWAVVIVGFILFYLIAWIIGIVMNRRVYGPDGKRIKKRRN